MSEEPRPALNETGTARLELKLVLIAGAPRKEYELQLTGNTIGRSADATITIDDPLVSRNHCKILRRGTSWVLVDLGSENSTLLNGKAIRESKLRHGDQIRVGTTTFYFSVTGPVPPNEAIEIIPPRNEDLAGMAMPQNPPSPLFPLRRSSMKGVAVVAAILILAAAGRWFWLRSVPPSTARLDGAPTEPAARGSDSPTRGLEAAKPETKVAPSLYGEKWAVIIGIDRYPNLGRRDQLEYAVADARAIESAARERLGFDRIVSLYNQDATKNDILAALDTGLAGAGPEDAVFVFFAGHGHTEATPYGDGGYILPHDGSFESGEMYRNISMTELSEVSKRIRAKHVFFAMDSCYSGQLLSGTRGSDPVTTGLSYERLRSLTSRRVRQVLTAGGKGEVVLDGGPFGHSVFTGRLLEAFQGSADADGDGFITVAELELYVGDRVFEDARRRGKQQNPQFGKLFSGEGMFVFELTSSDASPEN